jgi:drug/metabolite transporter (DMT)-like permease
MKPFAFYLGFAALGHALYHLGQKLLPTQANPMVLLTGAYSVALLLSALAIPFFRSPGQATGPSQVFNLPVLLLGASAVLIELGFLLLYRKGGGLHWAGVGVSALSALVLVPVGVLVFRESFSLTRLLGVVFTLGGLFLLVRK